MARTARAMSLTHTMENEIEIIPGTEVMTDISGNHRGPVLVPQPSNNLDDPLNWSSRRKTVVIFSQAFFVFMSVLTNLSISPLTPIYMAEWDKSASQIALLTGICVLVLGFSNFVIVPSAEIFGRRITIIICSIIILAADIWHATAKSYGSFLGARVLSGFGSAANESIMTVVITDIYFLHERGKYMGLYFYCFFIGLFFGPLLNGIVSERVSWRWFFWACTIAQAANFVTIILVFPETRYKRERPSLVVPPVEEYATYEKSEGQIDAKVEDVPPASLEDGADNVINAFVGKGRPTRAQFSLFQPFERDWTIILRHVITPIRLVCFPIILWASFVTSFAANSVLDINLTQSQVLSAPPYNFNTGNVGYTNFALIAGSVLGLVTAGPISDWVAMIQTRRNGGIREPEMRLITILPYAILGAIGYTVIACGYQYKWKWEVFVIVGYTLATCVGVSLPTVAITYAVDSYSPVVGQIMTTATVVKNTFGFGMTYLIQPWAVRSGFIPPMMLALALPVGTSLIGMVVYMIWGKRVRRWSKNANVHTF